MNYSSGEITPIREVDGRPIGMALIQSRARFNRMLFAGETRNILIGLVA